MRIGNFVQKLIVPLLIAAMTAACSTTDTLTPPADIGDSQPAVAQDFSAAQPVNETPVDENQFPAAPQQQVAQTQPENTSPALGSPGGISAANRSIFQSPDTQTAAAAPASGSIRFLPVIGAPVSAVTPLSQQLAAAARARGLTLKSSSDNSANHMLKGYFSAFADNGMTTVVYVWDILDASGARLHRIQQQEKVSGTSADSWSAVPAETMRKIANDTINEYITWKQNSGA